jgi:autotransporter-associated beta strand protein
MLPGFIVEGNAHRFVTYNGTTGFVPVADGAMVAMPAGAGSGNEVVNLTATTTMGSFATSIFALRGGNITLNSPTGANNDATITFTGSGSNIGSVISTTSTFTINPNLKFGSDGANEAVFYTAGNLQLNGNLTAGSVTKFGTGTMIVANDQSDGARGVGNGYQGGWIVNEGVLQFAQFGAPGNWHTDNFVVLNGSTAGSGQLNLRAQPADTLLNYTYNISKLFAVDFATLDWDPGAADRVHKIGDLEIQQSKGGTLGNGTLDAYFRVAVGNLRNILSAGSLKVANHAILNVDTTAAVNTYTAYATNGAYLTNSMSSGLSIAFLEASSNRLTKWGDGYLYIRGASPDFSGSVVIDQGPVHVSHSASLGTGPVTVNRYGTLDIGVAGFTPTNSSITYNEGSMERWSVDGARAGTVDLGKATLQVAANQPTANVAVTLNGGGIQGWLRSDDHIAAQYSGGVLRVLNPNVTFNISGANYLGDRYYEGANGLDSGKQAHDFRPAEEYVASGVFLEIKGVISGNGSMNKVGYDTVILSGANTYTGGTTVTGGRLLVGRDDALPTTGRLTTTANGVLDLNGQNQTVGVLNNVVTTTTAGSTQGFITNSGTAIRTLTVGNEVNSDFVYSGVIQHNVALAKTGSATLTLHNVNTYLGSTTINQGTLTLGTSGSINDSSSIRIGPGAKLDVSSKVGGYVYDGRVAGGGVDVAGTTYATVVNAARVEGSLVIGHNVGAVAQIGSLAPGGSSSSALSSTGNQVGHIYTSGALTLSGGVGGAPVNRMNLQLGGATASLYDLGYSGDDFASFIDTLPTIAADTLNGLSGSLGGHDYVNVGSAFTINGNGRIEVSFTGGYTPAGGDVFNLLDWGSLVNTTGFSTGSRLRAGGETGFDLVLPSLALGQFWDTSLFISYGTLVVVPEPGRVVLLLLGLLTLFLRRRRYS